MPFTKQAQRTDPIRIQQGLITRAPGQTPRTIGKLLEPRKGALKPSESPSNHPSKRNPWHLGFHRQDHHAVGTHRANDLVVRGVGFGGCGSLLLRPSKSHEKEILRAEWWLYGLYVCACVRRSDIGMCVHIYIYIYTYVHIYRHMQLLVIGTEGFEGVQGRLVLCWSS